jgi:NAD(P)-dependent dehydrogenase (short-subunit alcohol dehydrogenase family)
MTRYIRLLWLVQAALLLAVGGALVGSPEALKLLLPNLSEGVDLELVELFAPQGLGLGFLTLMVIRPAFGWLHESLATAFAASWLMALGIGVAFGAPPVILVSTSAFALANLVFLARPPACETPLSVRPSASDEAPMLGRIWGIQALYYAASGVLLLVAPEWVVEQLFGSSAGQTSQLGDHILHATAALYLAMAMMSHHAVGAQSDETWRSYCQAFLAAQWPAAIATSAALLGSNLDLTAWRLSVIIPSAALAFVNTMTLYDRAWIRRFIASVRGSLDLWWAIQAMLLAVVAWVAWFDARELIRSLIAPGELFGRDQRVLATAVFRLVGPLAVALLGLTVMAILSRDRRSRYDFGTIFVVGAIAALAALLLDGTELRVTGDFFYGVAAPVLLCLAAFASAATFLVWLFPDWTSSDERYRGGADTKPIWVYRLCVWQAMLFGAVAVVAAAWPEHLSTLLLAKTPSPSSIHPLVATVWRSSAPFWAAMAATSAFTASCAHEWSWRGLCRWFAVWQGLYVLTLVYIFDNRHLEQAALVWPTLIALIALANAAAARTPLRVNDLAGQPRPSGWLSSDLGTGLPLFGATLFRRARPYHRAGVGATGTFELADGAALPRTDFFTPRAEPMLCTVRFSNETTADDAALDARGCALSLSWASGVERLDLLMTTGSFGHVRNLAQAMLLRWAPPATRRKWLAKSYAAREASIAMLRRAPDTYAALQYHTRVVRLWVGLDSKDETIGVRCRMRLVPDGDSAESGLPDPVDAAAPWHTKRRLAETRPRDYLRAELADRLAAGAVRLRLEVQLGPAPRDGAESVDDAGCWYDATVDWDEADFPWRAVGTVVLTDALPHAATESLFFDPTNGGGVIATPRSASWTDERSLAEAQARAVHLLGSLRLSLYRVFRVAAGPPPGGSP